MESKEQELRPSATLTHLGLAGDQPRRLYQDDLDLNLDPERLAP